MLNLKANVLVNKKLIGIIPIILTIASYFFPLWQNHFVDAIFISGGYDETQRPLVRTIANLVLPLILLVFLLWLSSYLEDLITELQRPKQDSNIDRKVQQIAKALTAGNAEQMRRLSMGHRVREIGNSIECIDTIMREMEGADRVQNTFVTFQDAPEYEEAVAPVYEHFFRTNRNGIWQDLISYPEVFSKRFEMPLTDDLVGTRHHVRILRHNVPLINFMIIYKDEEPVSAYIGWVHEVDSRSPIFATRDRALARLFRRHFVRLWEGKTFHGREGDPVNKTIHVNYNKPIGKRFEGIDLVRKFGQWMTLSFGVAADGSIIEYSQGIVCIQLKHGTASVRGRVRRAANGDEQIESNISTHHITGDLTVFRMVQTANNLYFDYTVRDFLDFPDGFCLYRFVERDKKDAIEGFHVNDQSRVRRELIGLRIGDEISHPISDDEFDSMGDVLVALRSMALKRAQALS